MKEDAESLTVGKIKYVRFPGMKQLSVQYQSLQESIIAETVRLYKKFVASIDVEKITKISLHVAEIDVYNSCRKTSKHYCRPEVCEGDGYIKAVDMRHPIIEKVCEGIYVPTSLKIHKEKGILVYGVNSSGKSSVMKSLGLNLILAQAGMFVAAKEFKYTIYENVQTRILGNDDMYKGHSSFAVEMLELKGIIAKSGPRSIVFGDEICRGTETISGTAIAAATIVELLKKNTSFVFTTHLHEIVDIPEIKELTNLGVYHMKVVNDHGVIIYKRVLEEGSGDTLYGLEIAEAIGLPDYFISLAHSIRRGLTQETVIGKKSRYNNKVRIDKCAVCGEKAVDTHHLRPQKEAVDGYIDHFHMNNAGNLSGLCKKCHVKVTNNTISLKKHESTTGSVFEISES